MATAVYAGTFDPLTFGHLDIVERAATVFERLIVASTANVSKQPLFSLEDRLALLRTEVDGRPNVQIASFDGLLVEYAKSVGATVLVRGLRASSDFEYEFQMALMNRALAPDLQTVFLITSPQYMFVSSSIIKEVARSGGDVSQFVPPATRDAIIARLGHNSAGRGDGGA
jgi:pantetheine-phosphate adenylyltransferase